MGFPRQGVTRCIKLYTAKNDTYLGQHANNLASHYYSPGFWPATVLTEIFLHFITS